MFFAGPAAHNASRIRFVDLDRVMDHFDSENSENDDAAKKKKQKKQSSTAADASDDDGDAMMMGKEKKQPEPQSEGEKQQQEIKTRASFASEPMFGLRKTTARRDKLPANASKLKLKLMDIPSVPLCHVDSLPHASSLVMPMVMCSTSLCAVDADDADLVAGADRTIVSLFVGYSDGQLGQFAVRAGVTTMSERRGRGQAYSRSLGSVSLDKKDGKGSGDLVFHPGFKRAAISRALPAKKLAEQRGADVVQRRPPLDSVGILTDQHSMIVTVAVNTNVLRPQHIVWSTLSGLAHAQRVQNMA
jgi:hypothetical protein